MFNEEGIVVSLELLFTLCDIIHFSSPSKDTLRSFMLFATNIYEEWNGAYIQSYVISFTHFWQRLHLILKFHYLQVHCFLCIDDSKCLHMNNITLSFMKQFSALSWINTSSNISCINRKEKVDVLSIATTPYVLFFNFKSSYQQRVTK